MRRNLAIAGLLGGLFWIVLGFFPPAETREYEVLWNRLWTPALFGMLLGIVGLFLTMHSSLTRTAKGGFIAWLAGFALMIIGNVAEYWVLSDLPHEGPDGFIRGIAWMTFLFGTLVMQLASAIVGFNWLKSGRGPSWLSVLFLLLFPFTIGIGFVSMHWAGTPTGILSIAVGLAGLLQSSTHASNAQPFGGPA